MLESCTPLAFQISIIQQNFDITFNYKHLNCMVSVTVLPINHHCMSFFRNVWQSQTVREIKHFTEKNNRSTILWGFFISTPTGQSVDSLMQNIAECRTFHRLKSICLNSANFLQFSTKKIGLKIGLDQDWRVFPMTNGVLKTSDT